nr:IS3 family transposase [Clostridium gasigenes]
MLSHFCVLLGISRSGYYNYINTFEERTLKENKDLIARDLVLQAFDYRGYKKGSRSIKITLENEFNTIYSRKKIQRIMRKYNIVCPHRKANPYRRMAKATK